MIQELLQKLYDCGYHFPHNVVGEHCERCQRHWTDISERPCETTYEELIWAITNVMPASAAFEISHYRQDIWFKGGEKMWVWVVIIVDRGADNVLESRADTLDAALAETWCKLYEKGML